MATDTVTPVLSFPAILRNPGLTSRYAHLVAEGTLGVSNRSRNNSTHTSVKRQRRDENEGKRWVRRKDNARFVGNPHIVTATRSDYAVLHPQTASTFPEPLPSYLPRNVKLPTTPSLPATNPVSANAGRFSLSLKGMRRDLRRAGGRAEALIKDVESEMVQWLATGTILNPDTTVPGMSDLAQIEGTPVGNTGNVVEVSRTPFQLIWRIADDAFARYVVHCCARYHEVVSFSKGTAENRLTYLLRPNVTRPDHRATVGLSTPPITDIDYSSNPDTDVDSEFVSERELESDSDLEHHSSHNLSAITEISVPGSPALSAIREDSWDIIGEDEGVADGEFESGSEADSPSVEALEPRLQALAIAPPPALPEGEVVTTFTSVTNDDVLDSTVAQIRSLYSGTPRRRDWVSARSASSPSRSPARRRPARRRNGKKCIVPSVHAGKTFYEYLFM